MNNTKEQFGNSPDLDARILDAVMDALSAFTSMSRQALESERIRAEIKAILPGPGRLYQLLRAARSAGEGGESRPCRAFYGGDAAAGRETGGHGHRPGADRFRCSGK
ncbi:MAG: hypothetical protein ABTQ28_03570 [Thauera sp.]